MIVNNIKYNNVDVAWAEGLFEGEGCIYANKSTGVCLQIAMTDLDVLQRFQNIVKIGKVSGPFRGKTYKPFYKDCYRWRIASKPDVKLIYELFMPYLGIRRKAKFEELASRVKNCNTGRKWGQKGAALANI